MVEVTPPLSDIKPLPPTDRSLEGYTRVSEVLDYFVEPRLVDWMARKGDQAKRLSKQAKKVGTEVDLAIKKFVDNGVYGKVKTVEAKSCIEGFKRWYEDYKPALTVGKRLFNEEYKLTGEPDLYWGDRIIDIKCASAIRLKYHLQTGIYAFLDDKPLTAILRLHKHLSDYEYVERTNDEVKADYFCFLDMLQVYRYFQKPLRAAGEQHADSPSTRAF